jgi:protein phosphatase
MDNTITGSVLSDIGRRRQRNEDAVCAVPEACFYAVADGIGQMAFGGETSSMVCKVMSTEAERIYQDYQTHLDEEKTAQELQNRVAEVSGRIFRKGNTPEVYRYGCTFCGVMILEQHLIIVNTGDSRAYVKYRGETDITQVTEDHNLAAVASRGGYMTYQEAVGQGLASRLLNFIGISDETEVDLFLEERARVEMVLLCTDGLSGMVEKTRIAECIRSGKEPEQICEELIGMANENGGKDNVSVAVIRISDEKETHSENE